MFHVHALFGSPRQTGAQAKSISLCSGVALTHERAEPSWNNKPGHQGDVTGDFCIPGQPRGVAHGKEIRRGMVRPDEDLVVLTLTQEIVESRSKAQQILGHAGGEPIRVPVPFEPEGWVETLVHAVP